MLLRMHVQNAIVLLCPAQPCWKADPPALPQVLLLIKCAFVPWPEVAGERRQGRMVGSSSFTLSAAVTCHTGFQAGLADEVCAPVHCSPRYVTDSASAVSLRSLSCARYCATCLRRAGGRLRGLGDARLPIVGEGGADDPRRGPGRRAASGFRARTT
jgi:hypothetical protein